MPYSKSLFDEVIEENGLFSGKYELVEIAENHILINSIDVEKPYVFLKDFFNETYTLICFVEEKKYLIDIMFKKVKFLLSEEEINENIFDIFILEKKEVHRISNKSIKKDILRPIIDGIIEIIKEDKKMRLKLIMWYN